MFQLNRKYPTFKPRVIVWILASLLIAMLFKVGPVSAQRNSLSSFEMTTQARLEVERAWETYHHAALGGTLVSPAIQTDLEVNLHRSRALLADAYAAEERGDQETVRRLTEKILQITKEVIAKSQESKR